MALSSGVTSFSQMTVDTYLGSVMSNALCAVMFGIFKCTNFAEVLYSISQLVRLHVGPFIQFKRFFRKNRTASWS